MEYYTILEVKIEASSEEIKASYRRLVKIYHPDRHNGDEKLLKKFRLISEAYEILGNTESRSEYDKKVKSGNSGNTRSNESRQQTSQGFDPSQFFQKNDFFDDIINTQNKSSKNDEEKNKKMKENMNSMFDSFFKVKK